jgi:putative intracellular protease/amidase
VLRGEVGTVAARRGERSAADHARLVGGEQDHERGDVLWLDPRHAEGGSWPPSVEDYDGLILPGGVVNPDRLRIDRDAIRFIKEFFTSASPSA